MSKEMSKDEPERIVHLNDENSTYAESDGDLSQTERDESVLNTTYDAVSDEDLSQAELDDIDINNNESEFVEAGRHANSRKSEYQDLGESEIDLSYSDSDSDSGDLKTDSDGFDMENVSFDEEFEDEDKQGGTLNESKSVSNVDQNVYVKSPQSHKNISAADSSRKEISSVEYEGDDDETVIKSKSFSDMGEIDVDVDIGSPQWSTEAVKTNSTASSYDKESLGESLEGEEGEIDYESKAFSSTVELPQLSAEAADSTEFIHDKRSYEDSLERNEFETRWASKTSSTFHYITDITSSFSSTEALKGDSTSSHEKFSIEDSFEKEITDQDRLSEESKSFDVDSSLKSSAKADSSGINSENIKFKVVFEDEAKLKGTDMSISKIESTADVEKFPESPTKAMRALSISDSHNIGSKNTDSENTPRQSRLRAKTAHTIFDSPYNTRLKARMIREKDMRSRSEEGSTK